MSAHDGDGALDDLTTVRDWLRFAVTSFEHAGLAYGHGASNAVDEAAFLILETLRLPIEHLDPWLDCRLTRAERVVIRDRILARLKTRKPAAYLVNAAYIQGRKFYVDDRVIVPRSYLGELIANDRLSAVIANPDAVSSVLDLCTGSGCLAILAAEAFPNAAIDAADISPDALAVARRNIDDYRFGARIEPVQSDLFSSLAGKRYDVILCNPPYVAAEAVAAFPPEWRAEPSIAHLGGADGLDLVHRVIGGARAHLTEQGTLVVEIGQSRDALEKARPDLPFLWLETETSDGEVFALRAEDLDVSA